jgi:alginate O-acetyltransferase complex protein AlgI
MRTAFEDLGRLFGAGDIPLLSKEAAYYAKSYSVTILVAVIGCMPVIPWIRNKWMQNREDTDTLVGVAYIVKPILLIVLVLLSTAYLVDGSFNPFLYFRF